MISYGIVAAAGIASALQCALNSLLRKEMLSPWISGAIICCIQTFIFLALSSLLPSELSIKSAFLKIPWFGWTAAVLGCFIVYATFEETQKVGAGTFTAIFVTTSIITAILLDHFGLLGLAIHAAGTGRLIGAVFLVIGVLLVSLF